MTQDSSSPVGRRDVLFAGSALAAVGFSATAAEAQSTKNAVPTGMPPKMPDAKTSSPFSSMKGDHAGLRVPDIDEALAWYTEKLDFRVVHRWPYGDLKLAYVAPPVDNSWKVELLAGAGAVDRTPYKDLGDSLNLEGWHHICIAVDSTDATVAELRRRGVHIVTEPFDLPAISRRLAFFSDPWGNLFELTQVLA